MLEKLIDDLELKLYENKDKFYKRNSLLRPFQINFLMKKLKKFLELKTE